MVWLAWVLFAVLLCFGFVLLFGPPYLPTLTPQVKLALDLADLRPGETLLELGCGDGKVLIAAARRGWKVVGYELNPLLVLLCLARTWRYRGLVTVRWGNFLTQQWPECDAIFVFGLQRIMHKVDKKIMQSIQMPVNPATSRGGRVKLVSFAFTIPGKESVREQAGLRLYEYRKNDTA